MVNDYTMTNTMQNQKVKVHTGKFTMHAVFFGSTSGAAAKAFVEISSHTFTHSFGWKSAPRLVLSHNHLSVETLQELWAESLAQHHLKLCATG